MTHFHTLRQYIFTTVFVLLIVTSFAGGGKTHYFTGSWDGNMIQIINPQVINNGHFCIRKIYINGKKIKTNYKLGGLELDPSRYGFAESQELLIRIETRKDCEPTFHSNGFILQKD